MRWKGRERSENVIDRRATSPRKMAAGGGGIMILLLVLGVVFGIIDPQKALQLAQNNGAVGNLEQGAPADIDLSAEEEMKEFVDVTLKDTEDVWTELFKDLGARYQKPKLVVFRGSIDSACGSADSSVGPFYCPGDRMVYIDLSFFDDLAKRHRSAGDFPRAYVIAYEVGHHIQNLLGTSDKVTQLQQTVDEQEGNQLSVRLELQADFYAGVWAHHIERTKNVLEEGDIEEAIVAAQAIGDDRLQKEARGYVVPEKFTHGTSKQRAAWFMKGFKTGDLRQGDTFSVPYERL